MRRWLLACDYDYTLSIDGQISKENIEAVKTFRKNGGVFGIVSGRAGSSGPHLASCIPGQIDFVLCCTGAVLFETAERRETLACYPAETAALLYAFAKESGACGIGAFALERECLFDLGDPQADVLIAQFLKENQEINQSHIRFLNEEDASAETARLRGLLGACVNPQQNGRIMDIPPAGMDKAEGVRRMAERYGISQGDIYAAGDQYNDASMVETFHGFAMAHGVDALKIKAESVVKDVAEAVRIILQGPAG